MEGWAVSGRREGMTEKGLVVAVRMLEDELQKHMTKEDYKRFIDSVSNAMLRAHVESCKNEEFKKFAFENWDEITAPIDGWEDEE